MDWRQVLRNGFLPQMSDDALTAIKLGLERDDERLIQGATCLSSDDGTPRAACLNAYGGWIGDGLKTREQIENYFAVLCLTADQRTGVPFAIWVFSRHYDEVSRVRMRVEMLAEVERETARRAETRAAAVAG